MECGIGGPTEPLRRLGSRAVCLRSAAVCGRCAAVCLLGQLRRLALPPLGQLHVVGRQPTSGGQPLAQRLELLGPARRTPHPLGDVAGPVVAHLLTVQPVLPGAEGRDGVSAGIMAGEKGGRPVTDQGQDTQAPSRRWPDAAGFQREVAAMRTRIDALRAESQDASSEDNRTSLLAELDVAHEELRVAEEEVRAQQEELNRIVQGQRDARSLQERFIAVLPTPVLITDSSGLIGSANAAAAGLLGLRSDRLLRKPLFAFVSADDRTQLRQLLAGTLAHGRTELQATVDIAPRAAGTATRTDVAGSVRTSDDGSRTDIMWVLSPRPPGASTRAEPPEAERFAGTRLAHALVELTRTATAGSPREVLTELAAVCQGAFARPVAVSLTVGDPAAPDMVATGSKLAQTVDGAQVVAAEGPCHLAWQDGRIAYSTDLQHDERWPRLASYLADSPVRCTIAAPIVVGTEGVGALNVYSVSPHLVDEAALQAAELVAAAVGAVLHEAQVKGELETVAQQLETALQSRATIDQAKGILMARHHCDADEAFRMLARASSSANVKLREIAERLVREAAAGGSPES